jgi:LuxR family maltose regulon positive regulatory protein
VVGVKIRPPALRTDVVRRSRLTDALHASRARVVLVSAPAGFGKTVLALDWLAGRNEPVAWLSLDALDNDADRFFVHLGAALGRVPGLELAGEVLTGLPASSAQDPSAPVLAALEGAPPGTVLVLDDVHLVETPRVWTFLGRVVGDGPPGLRIALLTREDPPLRLGRLRVSGELLEIRERDLRFREDESARFFGSVGPDGLSPAGVARLLERTEGWAAGLRLAAAALQTAEDVNAAAESFGGSHELLVDYLLEEALRGRRPELQRFLMETSILPRFTVEGCRAVTGDPGAAHHLAAVEEANLFLSSLDGERRWFRYHHLFAELLSFRLERLDPDRVPVLRERAARWFEEQGELTEALAQASRVPDRRLLVRLLDRHGYDMLGRSEFASFSRWLDEIPDPGSWRWPMFLVAVTWFRVQVDRRTELDLLLARLDAVLSDPPPGYPEERLAEARLHARTIRAFWLRVHGRMDEALEVARDVLDRLPSGMPVLRGTTEFHVAAIQMRRAEMPGAREFLERARDTTRRGELPYIFLASLGHLGAVLAQTDGVPAARCHVREALVQAEVRRLDGLPAFGIVLYQAADVAWLADDPEEARAHLARADEVTRGEWETDIRANVLVRLARIESSEGRVERAEALLDEAAVVARGQSLQPFGTTLELERARLEEVGAGRLLHPDRDLAAEEVVRDGWTILREAGAVIRMRQALKAGRTGEAAALAALLERESAPRRRGVALCLALLARAATTVDAVERHRLLEAALARAEHAGYVRPLLDGGAPVRALLEAALARPLPDPVRDFVQRRLLPRFPAPTRRVPPPSEELGLTDRELELLRRLAAGRTNRELARELFVSENTVKTHLKHIFAKLDVSTRTAAVERARTLGILGSPEG